MNQKFLAPLCLIFTITFTTLQAVPKNKSSNHEYLWKNAK